MTKFNEDSRVKIPAILHLCRLGYKYISLNNAVWDADTNIFHGNIQGIYCKKSILTLTMTKQNDCWLTFLFY
jgi:hypothetical protein